MINTIIQQKRVLLKKREQYYEGYILEIEDDSFNFGVGGPMAHEVKINIKYIDSDFKSLSFLDVEQKCYKNAFWDDAQNKWIISRSR